MLVFSLTKSSMKRNRQVYIPYLIAAIIFAAMNYIFIAMINTSSLKKLSMGAPTVAILKLGTGFLLIVTFIFMVYVNHFIYQQRSADMNLYRVLGMTSHNLFQMVLLEKLILVMITTVIGVLFGIIFEKLAFQSMQMLMHIHQLHIGWWNSRAIGLSVAFWLGTFTLLSLSDVWHVHRQHLNDFWGHRPISSPAKTPYITGLLGFILLGIAYYLALTTKPKIIALRNFMVVVMLVIAATYLIFMASSVLILKRLQTRPNYYYQPNHFIAVSGMIQRMRANGASLATICLLCSAALVILFGSFGLYAGQKQTLQTWQPDDIIMTSNHPLSCAKLKAVTKVTHHYHVKLRKTAQFEISNPLFGYYDNGELKLQTQQQVNSQTSATLVMMDQRTYQRLTNRKTHLKNGEALYNSPNHKMPQQLQVVGHRYHLSSLKDFRWRVNPARSTYPLTFMVVKKVPRQLPRLDVTAYHYRSAGTAQHQRHFEIALTGVMQPLGVQVSGKATMEHMIAGLYGGLVFTGLLISLVLVIATAVVIYFKQIAEGYTDHHRFLTMQEVGLSKHETTNAIHSQVLMVFMLPVVGAVINLAFSSHLIVQLMKLMNLYDRGLLILVGAGVSLFILIVYLVIYGLTTHVYRQIVNQE